MIYGSWFVRLLNAALEVEMVCGLALAAGLSPSSGCAFDIGPGASMRRNITVIRFLVIPA
jgi:hypothetical protein